MDNKVDTRRLKWLQFRKDQLDFVYIKYDWLANAEFVEIRTQQKLHSRQLSTPNTP